jgi:hypothetical protein
MGLCREGQTRSAGMRDRYLLQYTLFLLPSVVLLARARG